MGNLKRIMIAGKTFPIKIDLNVLEHIQQEFGTINEFERKILGLEVVRDENGQVEYKENGEPKFRSVEVSISAIKAVLPSMINEGLAIEADEQNRSWEPVSDQWVYANCDIAFDVLGKMIHEEFKRCFAVKK